jgi:hypothetical protein
MHSTPPAPRPDQQTSVPDSGIGGLATTGVEQWQELDYADQVSELMPDTFVVVGVDQDGIVRGVGWVLDCPATGTTYMWVPGTDLTYKGDSPTAAARMMSRCGLTARLHECAPMQIDPTPVVELNPPHQPGPAAPDRQETQN